MASKDLLELLEGTLEELKGNATFARTEANKQPHEWFVDKDAIKNEIFTQLELKNYLVNGIITPEMDAIVDAGVGTLVANAYAQARALERSNAAFLVEHSGSDSFTVVVVVAQKQEKWYTTKSGERKSFYKDSDDVFRTIKDIYKKDLKNIRSNLNKYFKEVLGNRGFTGDGVYIREKNKAAKKDDAGNVLEKGAKADTLLQLGHDELSSVAEGRVEQARGRIFEKAPQVARNQSDLNALNNFLQSFGFTIEFDKTAGEDKTTIKVVLQSQFVNQGVQAAEERALVKEMRENIEKAIASVKAEDFLLSEGSDSRVTIEKKKILKRVDKNLKQHKNLTIKFEDTKIDAKPSKAKKDVKSPKGKRVKVDSSTGFTMASANSQKSRKSRPVKPPQQSYISLIPLLNKALPERVRQNMGPPGLTNRSGRFASSVRVENIITTRKGYPSIAYTYQKNPYQIFEPGAGRTPWSTEQRDPKKLIDRSIRDIAQSLIQERFYTRRV